MKDITLFFSLFHALLAFCLDLSGDTWAGTFPFIASVFLLGMWFADDTHQRTMDLQGEIIAAQSRLLIASQKTHAEPRDPADWWKDN